MHWLPNQHPLFIFAASLAALSATVWIAGSIPNRFRHEGAQNREDFNVIQGVTLTLLGLIIGFTFSMAIGRYDQRKVLEEAEANAIGTAYVRADILPTEAGDRVRALLKDYLALRVKFYVAGYDGLAQTNAQTSKIQSELWAETVKFTANRTDPVAALLISGMNDVINSRGYTQAAWWNRIPPGAWTLMEFIAFCACALTSFGARGFSMNRKIFFILPVVLSTAFFLIADIDSPREGAIRVIPQNLVDLAQSL